MKVLILCGGKGTRLGEVTNHLIPKPMVTIGDKPILWHIMSHFSSFGHNDFVLCVGHLSWAIKEYFLNYNARVSTITVETGKPNSVVFHEGSEVKNWRVTLVETGEDTATAGRIRQASSYLDEEPFLLTYGDGVSDVDLDQLIAFHDTHGKSVTITGILPPGRFGEMKLEGNEIVEWSEKPDSTERYINGGFMIANPDFLKKYVDMQADNIMLEREPLESAAKASDLMLFKHHGFWQCMDSARDWEHLNDIWRSGNAPWTR